MTQIQLYPELNMARAILVRIDVLWMACCFMNQKSSYTSKYTGSSITSSSGKRTRTEISWNKQCLKIWCYPVQHYGSFSKYSMMFSGLLGSLESLYFYAGLEKYQHQNWKLVFFILNFCELHWSSICVTGKSPMLFIF